MNYRCPLCRQPLLAQAGGLACARGHRFDRPRQGYVNLLPVQRKNSRRPGDNQAMVRARRAFLAAGHYDELMTSLARQIDTHAGTACNLLDVGCGEGSYTARLHRHRPELLVHGIDISKPAIALAARLDPQAHFAVASSFDLPFFDHVFDLVINIYAPAPAEELRRVLTKDGVLLVVRPGPDHLLGLKELIYEQVRRHPEAAPELTGFRLEQRLRVQREHVLEDRQAIADLLRMTPFYWHLDHQRQQRVLALERLHTPIDFAIDRYRPLS